MLTNDYYDFQGSRFFALQKQAKPKTTKDEPIAGLR